MRVALLLTWLMLPVLVGFYHFAAGQEGLAVDDAGVALRTARRHADEGRWAEAEKAFESALESLPEDRAAQHRRIRLELAKARMHVSKLPVAHQELGVLVDELKQDENADQGTLTESQAALANSQYYLTWLMRLEGQPRELWEPVIEASRQSYRLLAEQATADGDEQSARRNREDLESVIRLARMDLSDLQALSLPSQCQGCCSCEGEGRGKGKGKGQGKSMSKQDGPKDARGASSGPPPDGRGS